MSLRIVKSVSLSDKTAAIADSMPNFSAFVRAAILDYDDRRQAPGIMDCIPVEAFGGVCNGQRPELCAKCYPDGRPSQENWLEYVIDFRSDPGTQTEAWAKLQATCERIPDRVDDMLPAPIMAKKRPWWRKYWYFDPSR